MARQKKPTHHREKTYLKEWRKFRGLSQEAMAERVEIDRTTYNRIERGVLPYNQDTLERMAHAIGCDAADLLAVNPLETDPPRLVWNRLRKAHPDIQNQAFDVLEALLKRAG